MEHGRREERERAAEEKRVKERITSILTILTFILTNLTILIFILNRRCWMHWRGRRKKQRGGEKRSQLWLSWP